jgi:hypothetical protein
MVALDSFIATKDSVLDVSSQFSVLRKTKPSRVQVVNILLRKNLAAARWDVDFY